MIVEGHSLPGRTFCEPDGTPLDNVHVAVQVGREPFELVRGDAPAARWLLDITVVATDAGPDFRGKAVHGARGERFLYLTWGNVRGDGSFVMFRRAKLMLGRIDPGLVRAAESDGRSLVAKVQLHDAHGRPHCARVDPPAVEWLLV